MPEPASHEKILIRNEDGVVTEEATMRNGVLDGETTLYRSGRVFARLQFQDGKQQGEATYFDEIGQVVMKTPYQNGKLHGESTYFDHTGKIVRKENHEAGELQGRKTDFYP